MSHKLTLQYVEDESVTILLDGDVVGSFDHDRHGWAGMESAVSLARRMASKLDILVEETFE